MLSVDQIAEFLDYLLTVDRYSSAERGGVYRRSSRPITKLGLALEPWLQLSEWAVDRQLDAVFLHRPWRLEDGQLAPDIGVLSYHLPFDEHLTIGYNHRLAQVLGISRLKVLGKKEGRPIGMIGEVSEQSFADLQSCIQEVFGGFDVVQTGDRTQINRVAIVGAMTEALIHEAALRGADVYITGQLRKPAQDAVLETGINVIAVGHHRSEEWGLRSLAGILRARWFNLEVILPK